MQIIYDVHDNIELWIFFLCFPFLLYSSKDVRLPVQLQRAMAAEAEAAREARAKVSSGRRSTPPPALIMK